MLPIADGKYYSFYMSGFYNATAKTVDAFVVEDLVVAPTDYSVATVRFVNAIGNANPLSLYAKSTADTGLYGRRQRRYHDNRLDRYQAADARQYAQQVS